MLEHLSRAEAVLFLRETRRVLCAGGVLRLVVPDLERLAEEYLASRKADAFIEKTFLVDEPPQGVLARLKRAVAGPRHHRWMYDGDSLRNLLHSVGFLRVDLLEPGNTGIGDTSGLDLRERAEESIYVEAVQP